MHKITKFDLSEYLDSKESISEYLSQILKDGDMDEFLEALGNVAKSKGMSEISKNSGLGRQSLYKVFNNGAKPGFETINKIISSFGLEIKISA
ncbi:MAG: Toxin-antitoxin system, antitoxin component [uncultured Campylobacterales bacterium]|uniref:Toxin-antitoxin system, antitoxin component n=1 Tax=uncultured Campylobacterales bacterium TaxID=352960 RepID=A0A6S6T8I9_9BACT|nr:MAG: Toxin-antitoxin system, antitoxin component [uncultured Campylobacterales bacterium]